MIGIISGEGSLPKVLINNFYKHNIKFLVINLSKIKILKKNFYNLNISQFSKILKILKDICERMEHGRNGCHRGNLVRT